MFNICFSMTGKELLDYVNSQDSEGEFLSLYGKDEIDAARRRYSFLIGEFSREEIFPLKEFPEARGELRIFSVPGRTELGGNHTDHNRGKVLAASIQLDAVAVVAPRKDKQVVFKSVGHKDVKIDISDLSIMEKEKGRTEALVRGIAAEFSSRGTPVGGFTACADNMVLTGSGLSSSAAIEVLFAKIFDNLYCGGKRKPLELAQIGQKAENIFFGKPCGLMDQTACASGGAVAIDFEHLESPKVRGIGFDPASAGFALCVVDTKGSHSDLTPDYAAIPAEMRAAAAVFGKQVLRELDEQIFMERLKDVRAAAGDRAVLRALHFFSENRRVDAMLAALENLSAIPPDKKGKAMETFLSLVTESGDSSWELLQNVYSPKNPSEQGLTLALALTRNFLFSDGGKSESTEPGPCRGACRVHGGGFAGTIQVYLPLEKLNSYRGLMEGIFGKGALTVLRIRPLGAIELECK